MQIESDEQGQESLHNTGVMLAACGTALGTLSVVALYQLGVLRHLPDPPLAVFDSDRITSSRIAHPMGIPDSLLGLASFSVTCGLIIAARRCQTARRLLGAKLVLDVTAAAFDSTRQVVRFGKLCSWCVGTATAAGVMAVSGRQVIAASAVAACEQAERLTGCCR